MNGFQVMLYLETRRSILGSVCLIKYELERMWESSERVLREQLEDLSLITVTDRQTDRDCRLPLLELLIDKFSQGQYYAECYPPPPQHYCNNVDPKLLVADTRNLYQSEKLVQVQSYSHRRYEDIITSSNQWVMNQDLWVYSTRLVVGQEFIF